MNILPSLLSGPIKGSTNSRTCSPEITACASAEHDRIHHFPSINRGVDYECDDFDRRPSIFASSTSNGVKKGSGVGPCHFSSLEDVDSTDLVTLLATKHWGFAIERIREDPSEARKSHRVCLYGDSEMKSRAAPLHLALTKNPPVNVVEELVKAHPLALTKKEDVGGKTPLHLACMHSAGVECLEVLISASPGVLKAADKSGRIPLHYACAKGIAQEVATLLEHDPSSFDAKDAAGLTPLALAQTQKICNPNIAEIIQVMEEHRELIERSHEKENMKEPEKLEKTVETQRRVSESRKVAPSDPYGPNKFSREAIGPDAFKSEEEVGEECDPDKANQATTGQDSHQSDSQITHLEMIHEGSPVGSTDDIIAPHIKPESESALTFSDIPGTGADIQHYRSLDVEQVGRGGHTKSAQCHAPKPTPEKEIEVHDLINLLLTEKEKLSKKKLQVEKIDEETMELDNKLESLKPNRSVLRSQVMSKQEAVDARKENLSKMNAQLQALMNKIAEENSRLAAARDDLGASILSLKEHDEIFEAAECEKCILIQKREALTNSYAEASNSIVKQEAKLQELCL